MFLLYRFPSILCVNTDFTHSINIYISITDIILSHCISLFIVYVLAGSVKYIQSQYKKVPSIWIWFYIFNLNVDLHLTLIFCIVLPKYKCSRTLAETINFELKTWFFICHKSVFFLFRSTLWRINPIDNIRCIF